RRLGEPLLRPQLRPARPDRAGGDAAARAGRGDLLRLRHERRHPLRRVPLWLRRADLPRQGERRGLAAAGAVGTLSRLLLALFAAAHRRQAGGDPRVAVSSQPGARAAGDKTVSETPQEYEGALDRGLEGVVTCTTSISTIEGTTLLYRGYTIEDLAKNATFEE